MNAKNTNKMPKNWWTKLEEVKRLIRTEISEKDVPDLLPIVSKVAHYHYNKEKYLLLGLEGELYILLIDNNYNPYTVYRWFLLDDVPEDIRFQIKNDNISQKKAFNLKFEKRNVSEDFRDQILLMGRQLVRGM